MKRQNVHSAIGALTTLFYVHQDTEMGRNTNEKEKNTIEKYIQKNARYGVDKNGTRFTSYNA